jgi:hypothetical protein
MRLLSCAAVLISCLIGIIVPLIKCASERTDQASFLVRVRSATRVAVAATGGQWTRGLPARIKVNRQTTPPGQFACRAGLAGPEADTQEKREAQGFPG